MKNIRIIIFCIAVCLTAFAGCSNGGKTYAPMTYQQSNAQSNAEETFSYTQDFTDLKSVNRDFKFYYLTKFGGTLLTEQATDSVEDGTGHWAVENGTLKRYGSFDVAEGSGNIAMAFLSVRKFRNFEMTVEIRQGTQTNFWSIFSIRHDECGRHYAADGEAFYFDADGTFKTWGHGFHGGPYLIGSVNNYDRAEWYTYHVVVSGNYMFIEIGRESMIVKMPEMFYRTGYISFMSVNNDMSIRNLKIKALPDSAEVLPDRDPDQTIPSADSEDSLDNIIKESENA